MSTRRKRAGQSRRNHGDGADREPVPHPPLLPAPPGEGQPDGLMPRDLMERIRAEEALRASEERFRSVYAAVGQATISLDGRFLQVNRAFCELTGYTEAELLATTMPAITVPEDVAPNLDHDRRLLTGEISHFHMEKRYRRKDGGIVTVLLSAAAVYDADGAPQYIIGLVQDITERKRTELELQRAHAELEQRVQERTAELSAANARLLVELQARQRVEEALRRSEQDYRTLFERANDAIIIFEPTNEIVLEVNERACAMYGMPREEFVGSSLRALSEDPRRGERYLQALLREGSYQGFESVQRRADGAPLHLFINASMIQYQGRQAVLSINRDMTAAKQAEAALGASEARLRTVVTNAQLVLFALDRDGIYTLLAGQGLAALGLTEGELVGRSVFDIYRDEPAVLANVRRGLAGQSFTVTTALAGRIFETRYSPLRDTNGSFSGTIGVATDITERQRAEEARLALDQLKADFVANISHELRTPLHHIKGYAALLSSRGGRMDADTQQEFLDTIVDASDRLARLVDDMLDTSQITAGGLALELKPNRLDTVIRSVVQRWSGISSHRFHALLPDDIPVAPMDVGRIEQVLDNLLTNVVRYTPGGTVAEVRVVVRAEAMEVAVADQGPGVPAEHLPHLFERFFQAPRSEEQRRGNGLGLFICKWIVEQHHGQIWAESPPGAGLTIRFTLPRPNALAEIGLTAAHNERPRDPEPIADL